MIKLGDKIHRDLGKQNQKRDFSWTDQIRDSYIQAGGGQRLGGEEVLLERYSQESVQGFKN